MSKRNLSEDNIKALLVNKNIVKCSSKTISYSKEFKLQAVKQYNDGLSPQEIFRQAGFDLKIIGGETPGERLKDWIKVFKAKGIDGLIKESRGHGGGRPKTKWEDDKKKVEFLEAKVAYLKAENDFLTQLRKKKGLD